MAEYKGSIELISGLKPKNNGDFALVNAKDIQVDDAGTRLDAKIIELDNKQIDVDTVFQDPTFVALTASVNDNADRILAAEKSIEDILSGVDEEEYGVQYVQEDSKLYLYKGESLNTDPETGNVISSTIITGGGGGGADAATVVITRVTPASSTTIYGQDFELKFHYASKDASGETLQLGGTAKLYINNVLYETKSVSADAEDSFNVGKYLLVGSNSIRITITNSEGTGSGTQRWTINAVDMRIASSFDDTVVKDSDVILYYTPYGDVEKTIYFELNGEILQQIKTTATNRLMSITIPKQVHGSHQLKIWCTATVNEEEITSNILHYDIMFAEAGNNTPIIRTNYDGSDAEQYSAKVIKYNVYVANDTKPTITLAENGKVLSTLTVDRSEQSWSYKPTEAGDVILTITCGDTAKLLNLHVKEFPYDIEPVTAGLGLDFNPAGRSNNDDNYAEFTYGDYSWTLSENFDWINGGWKLDTNGDSYFCIKAGDRMSINYPLFGDDPKVNGKNFKMIYKATRCSKMSAPVMECFRDNSGIKMTAQNAYVYYEGATPMNIPYYEDTYNEFEINIQPNNGDNGFREVVAYLNADPCRAKVYTDEGNTLNQTVLNEDRAFAPIVFGSDECDVHLYRFKAYTSWLSDTDLMNNFFADAPNAGEMAERYVRNDILNESGELDYNKIAQKFPDMRILLITGSRFTKDKKETIENCTVQQIMGNGDPKHNWTSTKVKIKGQGTSSNEYKDSSLNFDINCKKTGFTYTDGSTSSKYAMTDNSVAVNYFNIKVNVASSENANNALFQAEYNDFQPYLRLARQNNPKVRDTMEFHPVAVFIKETEEGGLTSQWFPADGQFHFYSCGDFGNSKKNNEAMGMNENNPKECIIEISNNIQEACRFKSDDLSDEIIGVDEEGNETTLDTWDGDVVEFRYPDAGDLLDIEKVTEDFDADDYKEANPQMEGETDEEYEARITALIKVDAEAKLAENTAYVETLKDSAKRLWSWVVSTDSEQATNEALPQAVTYDNVRYTTDSAEYRLAKFKNEVDDYFIKDSLLYHYLFTERHLMIDNRAKNTFIHTEDGIHWDYVFDYDNDTADGNDNVGGLTFDYGYEDIDTLNGRNVYNASDSVVWVNVRKCLHDDLVEMFTDRENAGAWDANRILKRFDEYQAMKCERLQMFDMRRKYLRPFEQGGYLENEKPTARYLEMLYGKKTFQRMRFEKYQEKYSSSKYASGTIKKDLIIFRVYTPTDWAGVAPGKIFNITPYADIYVNMDFDNTIVQKRAKGGEAVQIALPAGAKADDLNTRIYAASMMQNIGDLAPFYVKGPNIASAVKLNELILGSPIEGYNNKNLDGVSLGSNELLEKFDIRNCTNLTSANINLANCVSAKEVYTTGSNVSGVTFAEGGLLEIADLNAINTLFMKNLFYITSFNIASYENLTKMTFANCPAVDVLDIINQATNLRQVRIEDVNWDLANTTLLNRLYKMSGINDNGGDVAQSVITGYVHVDAIKSQELKNFKAAWPNLEIEADDITPQYKVEFRNWDGTELYTTYVDAAGRAEDPISAGLISTPTKESDAQFDYTFSGWDTDLSLAIVNDKVIVALYDSTIRTYSVKWVDSFNNILDSTSVQYGESATYSKETPTRESASGVYYIFDGWDKASTFVSSDIIIKTKWISGMLPSEGTELVNMNTAQLAAIIDNGLISRYLTDDSYAKLQMGYMPSFDNVEEDVLVDENGLELTGKNHLDTGYKLFGPDSESFTLAIDFTPAYSATPLQNVLVSCYNDFSNVTDYPDMVQSGFQLFTTNNSAPRLKWGPNAIIDIHQSHAPTNKKTYRDIIVIRYVKGDTNLYVYTNDRYSNSPVVENILRHSILPRHYANLVLGADKSVDGEILSNSLGRINYAKLWKTDLGAEECKDICSWVYETRTFDYVGSGRYGIYGATKYSNASFVDTALLDEGHVMKVGNSSVYNWSVSAMRTWMNNKVYAGMPLQWKQLMKKVIVKSLSTNSSTQAISTVSSNGDYLYIPAVGEVNSLYTMDTNYSQELRAGDFAYPVFTNSASRVKHMGNENGVAAAYHLRTPSIQNIGGNYHTGVDKNGETYLMWNSAEEGYSPATLPYGVCTCFSI